MLDSIPITRALLSRSARTPRAIMIVKYLVGIWSLWKPCAELLTAVVLNTRSASLPSFVSAYAPLAASSTRPASFLR